MFIKTYLIALGVFLATDLLWLAIIAKDLYRKYLGYLMTDNVNFLAAFIFYLLFIVGLIVFVIQPAIAVNSWIKALILGLLFGLITYATYDLTNLATVRNWPILITIIDLIWGSFLSAFVSITTFFIVKKLWP